jgi:hypothetical protein
VAELRKTLKIGAQKTYRMLNELTRAGYACRYQVKESGRWAHVETLVFETKKSREEIKKYLPCAEKPLTVKCSTYKVKRSNKISLSSSSTPSSSSLTKEKKETKKKTFPCAKAQEGKKKTPLTIPEWEAEKLASGYTREDLVKAWERHDNSTKTIGNLFVWMDKALVSVQADNRKASKRALEVSRIVQKQKDELRVKNEELVRRFNANYKGKLFRQLTDGGIRINDEFFLLTDEDLENNIVKYVKSCERLEDDPKDS